MLFLEFLGKLLNIPIYGYFWNQDDSLKPKSDIKCHSETQEDDFWILENYKCCWNWLKFTFKGNYGTLKSIYKPKPSWDRFRKPEIDVQLNFEIQCGDFRLLETEKNRPISVKLEET